MAPSADCELAQQRRPSDIIVHIENSCNTDTQRGQAQRAVQNHRCQQSYNYLAKVKRATKWLIVSQTLRHQLQAEQV